MTALDARNLNSLGFVSFPSFFLSFLVVGASRQGNITSVRALGLPGRINKER